MPNEVRPVVVRMHGKGHYCNYSIMGVDGDWWRASDGRRRRWSTMQAAEDAMQIPGPELPLTMVAETQPDEEDPEPDYTPGAPPLSREARAKRLAQRHGLTEADSERYVGRQP